MLETMSMRDGWTFMFTRQIENRCGRSFEMFAPLWVMRRLGQPVIFSCFPQFGDTPESGSCEGVYHDKQGAQTNEVDQKICEFYHWLRLKC